MIAQVVFDLPLEGPFDYLIPEHLASQVAVGSRVKVFFGPKRQVGFVVSLLEKSNLTKLKSILSLPDAAGAFNDLELNFARDFSAYYGCSLGEALGTIFRNKKDHRPSVRCDHKPVLSLYRCPPASYSAKIQEIISSMSFPHPTLSFPPPTKTFGGKLQRESRFLILVPDAFRAQMLSGSLPGIKIGTRSSVFECDGQYDCVIMVDEEDASYKQEQMPMYETRQVLMARSKIFGFDIVFVGLSPSVELMGLVREGRIKLIEETGEVPAAKVIDLSNYKFVPGMISVPVRDALEQCLKAGQKSILILKYKGIKVEKVQNELKKFFPQARILTFQRPKRVIARTLSEAKGTKQSLNDFDILISTQAVLRFQGTLKVQLVAFIDFDAELNRLEARSAFHAFSLYLHISSMARAPVLVQTRNSVHYVLQSLVSGNTKDFYDQELKLRKEFGFSPYKHWVKISCRGKSEKTTQSFTEQVYNVLGSCAAASFTVTPPLSDVAGLKPGQFRYNVMVQADDVAPAVALIKSSLAQIKRRSRVIMTMNVDP
jgi:primosomal protein N'